MLNLKKTAVAVLAFGSSAVFAGTMGPVCAPGNVTVPCASTAWDFGVQALYLEPSHSGHAYYSSGFNSAGTEEHYHRVPKDWGWGFKLEGSYHFSTGNDLNLNWYHLDHTANNTHSGEFTVFPASGAIASLDLENGSASAQVRWDAVNLEFGQLSHFGEWKNIRFHGGVQYARIQKQVSASADIVENGLAAGIHGNHKYDGFGPRVGIDYNYNWGNGFAMYANGASALLVGSQSFDTQATIEDISGFTQHGSATAVVPELEAKLGLAYTYAMAQGDLSLDVGWMWVNYFDALSSPVFFGHTKESNFAVQGPFVGLKWVGNVA